MIAKRFRNFFTHFVTLLLTTVLATAVPNSARCEQLVLQCHFLDGTKGGGYAATVNQIVVDLEQEVLDFRAAETIGTANPRNYKFQTMGSDKLVLSKSPNGFVAGGLRYGTPFAINIDLKKGLLVWSYIDGEITEHSRYQCAP